LAIKQQKRTIILATHKQEFLSKADYVIVCESGLIKHQGTLAQIEKEDKAFFYQWNVIKQKEIQERMIEQCKKKCKTSEERSSLVRLMTKKTSFRRIAQGAITSIQLSKSVGCKRSGLSRQMSYDTSNAMPCHNWGEHDDVFEEQNESQELCNSSGIRRMQSIESEGSNKRESYLSLNEDENSLEMNLNSYSSSNQSSTGRPPMERLCSRISNRSIAMKASIREEDEDETEIDEALKQDTISKGSRGSDTSSLEDNTRDMDHELLNEMHNYNEVYISLTTFSFIN